MRFLAEAAWYPTALLPSQGLEWKTIDGFLAKATLKDGETAVTLLFRFGENGQTNPCMPKRVGAPSGAP